MEPLTAEALKTLADDIRAGRIFTSAHIATHDNVLGLVFMPLAFMSAEDRETLRDVGMAYEYLDKAGPRCINGYPMFFSVRLLSKEDTEKVFAIIRAIDEAVAAI